MNILLIEDNPDDVFLFNFALKKMKGKFNLSVINNGEDALKYFDQVESKEIFFPKVVFLDVNIPRLSGLEVLKGLSKNILNKVPIVVFTSSDSQRDVELCYKLGVKMHFKKLNNLIELKEKLLQVFKNLNYG